MEIIKTHCNLDIIKTDFGIYDIQKVTDKQEIPYNTWIDIIGSSITYKPQDTSNKLNYFYNTYIIGDPSSCLLYTSPSPRDGCRSRMPSSA